MGLASSERERRRREGKEKMEKKIETYELISVMYIFLVHDFCVI